MNKEAESLRSILSMNIKHRRKVLGISQEKLAKAAELSTQTVNDIEGCRIWVSDKTMVKLAGVLQVEVYQLLLPAIQDKQATGNKIEEKEMRIPSSAEILLTLQQTIKNEIDLQFYGVLKSQVLH
ncbi:MAG: helix-turn-helix domain-containing protein [Treponema sp.]|jgi:transcriptional regulator with XRE-family HTH domain|nr:helix-turn-helix domain-containing protein [Treponema sp.]